VCENLRSEAEAPTLIAALVHHVVLRRDAIELVLSLDFLITEKEQSPDTPRIIISRTIPMQLRQRGREMRLIIEGAAVRELNRDRGLIKLVARAFRWFEDLSSRRASSLMEIGTSSLYLSNEEFSTEGCDVRLDDY
jgi:hypothetical protein